MTGGLIVGDFISTALEFPAVVFTFPLAVVLLYWLFAIVFGVGVSAAEGVDGAESGGSAGVAGLLGFGGVPVAVPVSLLIAFTWFTSMAGTEFVEGDVTRALVVPGALLVGWAAARILVIPLRRVFPSERTASRRDFIGRVGIVRTSSVTSHFGQAEVTADDGGSAVVQVRAEGPEAAELSTGSRALLFGYDAESEFFWVAPYDSGIDASPPHR